MLDKRQEKLAQKVVAALVLAESAKGEARANHIREAATNASVLRMTFETSKEDRRPDVRGRSYGYRTAMTDIYNQANTSKELRSAFRYHSNIVHKERVGPAALKEFGIDERTRAAQHNDRRVAQQAAAAVGRAQMLKGEPSAHLRPLEKAQQLLGTVNPSALGELQGKDRRRAQVLAKAVAAVAGEVLRVTK